MGCVMMSMNGNQSDGEAFVALVADGSTRLVTVRIVMFGIDNHGIFVAVIDSWSLGGKFGAGDCSFLLAL